MTPAVVAGICGGCREGDCECCDLSVWGGYCDCGCAMPARQPDPILCFLNEVLPRNYQSYRTCRNGHALTKDNLYQYGLNRGTNRCLECRRNAWRKDARKRRNGHKNGNGA